MASELQPNDDWERVASELRAYRAAQEQAWGEIDNAMLGRFLADEVSGEERRQIEHALDERPELRKLTDLVRDVLADFEPVADRLPAPTVPVPTPRILPFPRKQPGRPSIVRWVKKRSGMLAAACLLLVLSGSLLDPRTSRALFGNGDPTPADDAERVAFAMSRTGHQPFYVHTAKPAAPLAIPKEPLAGEHLASAPNTAGLNRLELLNQQIDGYEQQGKLQQALDLDEKAVTVAQRANLEQHLAYAANRERVAVLSQKQGDLDRAYHSLNQAYEIRKKEQGLENKDTAKTVQSLANVYAMALNSRGGGPANHMVAAMAVTPAPPAPAAVVSRMSGPDRHPEGDRKNVLELHDRLVRQDAVFLQRQVVPVMVQGLENATTEKEREEFVLAIGNLGPNAAPAAPVLVARLQRAQATETIRERRMTLWALGQMGPEARDAVPVLVESLDSSSAAVSQTAADALVHLGPHARESLGRYLQTEANADAAEVRRRGAIQNVLKRFDEHSLAKSEVARSGRNALGIVAGAAATKASWGPVRKSD